jgi:hypothetical protein
MFVTIILPSHIFQAIQLCVQVIIYGLVSLEKILKSMTSYMTNFVVIPNIIQLKTFICNKQVAKDNDYMMFNVTI